MSGLLQSFNLEHLPLSHTIHIALFKNVKNSAFLHQQLLAGNTEFEYAFLDASLIAESFRRFGVQATTQNLLVVKVSTPLRPITAEMAQTHLDEVIEGEQVSFDDDNLSDMTDVARVKKIYKLNTVNSVNGDALKKGVVNGAGKGKDWRRELEILLLGAMALRGDEYDQFIHAVKELAQEQRSTFKVRNTMITKAIEFKMVT
ncbi:hypothetical protein B7463_g3611, partial [Scytalidium lignicola]